MTDRDTLNKALQALVKTLEADLLQRAKSHTPTRDALKADHAAAVQADRTGDPYSTWLTLEAAQLAVAWVLSAVFVRFLEDNHLIDPVLAGPGNNAPGTPSAKANDHRDAYFNQHPENNDRQYLLYLFDQLAQHPPVAELFGDHNPLRQRPDWLSADAAQDHLVRFFRDIDPDTGELKRNFDAHPADHVELDHVPALDTRFLGDLYQDLSEATRKRYALLQTPDFVEDFILDRTLTPALKTFGLEPTDDISGGVFKIIDPACGSGHFLLGAFARILSAWQRKAPALSAAEHVISTLKSIHGVDLNPYAVAIARFRLLLAAMHAAGIARLSRCPDFALNLACGDSLLHGSRPSSSGIQQSLDPDDDNQTHIYATEDREQLVELLQHGRYHAVVANPPYITVKDKQQNQNIRDRYGSCSGKYALSVPFMERLFDLAIDGSPYKAADGIGGLQNPPGFVGQITANSFMKREFGKKLIQEFIPRWNLTHVVDTSGAYIPGHGTPTVILFGRPRQEGSARADTIRTVMGIRGEPATPAVPAEGKVWSAILDQIDHPGSESDFISVNDTPRQQFESHPWSIGGGGAAELKRRLEENGHSTLSQHIESIGFGAILGEDEIFSDFPNGSRVRRLPSEFRRPLVEGTEVRDWNLGSQVELLFPYSEKIELVDECVVNQWIWTHRTTAWARPDFSKMSYREAGRTYWEYHQIPPTKYRTPLSITFAFVATHNHFVLDRGGKVFKQSAPVIKLPPDATEADHLALLALLNSSAACFWMKQVFHDKGSTVDSKGARQTTVAFENFREFTGTGLQKLPLPESYANGWGRLLDDLAHQLQNHSPAAQLRAWDSGADQTLDQRLAAAATASADLFGRMIALQEELDWATYHQYGLTADEPLLSDDDAPPLKLGERAFEIVMGRKIAAGELDTTWFIRHGSTPLTELPDHWPADYQAIVNRRIEAIEANPKTIGLIEAPEYKRRWNQTPWDQQVKDALHAWLLNRLEACFDLDGRMSPPPPEAPEVVGQACLTYPASIAGSRSRCWSARRTSRSTPRRTRRSARSRRCTPATRRWTSMRWSPRSWPRKPCRAWRRRATNPRASPSTPTGKPLGRCSAKKTRSTPTPGNPTPGSPTPGNPNKRKPTRRRRRASTRSPCRPSTRAAIF